MFPQKLCLAFLTLALSSFLAQAAPRYHNFAGRDILSRRADTVIAIATRQDGRKSGGGKNNGDNNGGNNGNSTGDGGNNNQDGNNNQGGNQGGNNGNGDAQTSLTLDPAVIAKGFANDGQDVPTQGQAASLTSTNNFINFCLTVDLPITNGQQLKGGSCNPAPMGAIPSTDNMPSSKFAFPQNLGAVKTNTPFTIEMAIKNLETGNFVNANNNYYAAPQHLNAQGQIIGHSHVVVEQLDAIDQTTPTDPNKFAFFKGLNVAAVDGKLSADVSKGLPAGIYKLSSINAAANHQPILVPIAQHGSLDDVVYFFVTDDGQPPAGAGIGTGNGAGGADNATGASGAGGAGNASGASGADGADGAGGSGAGNGKGGNGKGGNGKGSTAEDGAATATGKNGAANETATGKNGAATATATSADPAAAGQSDAATATPTGKVGGAKGSNEASPSADPAVTGKSGAATGKTGSVKGSKGTSSSADSDAAGESGAATATATGKVNGAEGADGASTSADPTATGKTGTTAGTGGGNDDTDSGNGASDDQTTKDGSTSSKDSNDDGSRIGSQGRN